MRFIYEQYARGVYVKDIIKTLTEKGIFNRGKKFAKNTVYNILKNEKYSGVYHHNGETFTNMYPQIGQRICLKSCGKRRNKTNTEAVAWRLCTFFAIKLSAVIAAVLFLPNAERLKTEKRNDITNAWDENIKTAVQNLRYEKKYSKSTF